MKRLRAESYQELRNALPVIHWYKKAFESFLRDALRMHPELLVGLDLNGPTKREIADVVVTRLAGDEDTYHQTTLELMLDVAAMNRFPDIERIKDPIDRDLRVQEAYEAVGRLRMLTASYREQAEARARIAAAKATDAEVISNFSDDLEALLTRYLEMRNAIDPHQRGRDFERLLNDLFTLFDMEPRISYRLPQEQIDGSLSFDTDDYIVEARWRAEKLSQKISTSLRRR